MEYLESKSVLKPHLVSHEIQTLKGDAKIEVKVSQERAFEQKALPANQKPSFQNPLSMVPDMGSLGDFAKVVRTVKYLATKQQQGLYPQEPGLFLRRPLTLQKGKLYQLTSA